MDAWGYFTPAREEEFCWNRTTEKTPRAGSSPPLSGPEAKRFYESLTKGVDDDEEERRRRRKNHREEGGGRRRDGDRKAEGRGGGALGEGGRRDGREEPGQQVQSGNVRHIKVERTDEGGGGHGEGSRRREGGTSESRRRRRSSRERRTHAPQRGVVSSSTMELQGLKLLRCAQEGDLSGLKEQLSRGADINFQDTFFWTAVMCASWSGQRPAVRLLLQRGAAWVGVVDTKGRDARDLAVAAGHQGVLEELESYGRSPQQDTQPDARRSHHQQPPQQRCEVCGVQYSCSLASHLSSTLHQFNLRRPPPTPQYCLPASSASYKMMLRCGWNPTAGLGPEGEGPRQPVPTVLKRDHKGLGYGPAKRAKVTHFPAKDPKAVKKVLPDDREHRRKGGDTGKRKGVARREEEREKCWERDFRNSFHIV